jgi:hypothetical protein
MSIRIGWGKSLLPHLLQSVPTFNEVDQSLHEARRRGAVYDVMVEGDCQVEEVARFHALINDSWFAGDARDGLGRRPGT